MRRGEGGGGIRRAGAPGPYESYLRGTLLQNGLHEIIRRLRAARHQRRAVASALFAARHAHPHEHDLLGLKLSRAPLRVRVPLVAAINDEVTLLHVLRKESDRVVDRLGYRRGGWRG